MNIAIISPIDISLIITPKDKNSRPVPWTENLAKYLSKCKNNEVHIITGISPQVKKYPRYKKIDNIHFHLFKTAGRFSPLLFYIIDIIKIRKILARIKPDIVHGEGVEWFYGMAAIFSGYPYVVTIHGIMNEIFKDKKRHHFFPKLLEKIALKLVKNVISLNPYIDEILKIYAKTTYNKKNIYHIPNPVAPQFFYNSKVKDNDVVKIVYCGVIRPRKGLMDLLIALKEIENKGYIYNLFIIGMIGNDSISQDYFIKIKSLIKGMKNQIKLIGYVEHEKLPEIFKKMDILVLPSKAETAPMVLSEAMASSIATIAYDVGGVKYIIKNNETGYVVPLNNINELKNKIEKLIIDKNLRKRFGTKAREVARRLYHPENVGKETLKFYNKIIKG